MKKFVAVVAIALMVASCGSNNTTNVAVADSTAVANDTTAVVDSAKVDSSVVK